AVDFERVEVGLLDVVLGEEAEGLLQGGLVEGVDKLVERSRCAVVGGRGLCRRSGSGGRFLRGKEPGGEEEGKEEATDHVGFTLRHRENGSTPRCRPPARSIGGAGRDRRR